MFESVGKMNGKPEKSNSPPKYLAVPPDYVGGSLLSVARYPHPAAKLGIIFETSKHFGEKMMKARLI